MKFYFTLTIFIIGLIFPVLAQQYPISGRVLNEKKQILHGATISLTTIDSSQTSFFTVVDSLGNFSLKAPTNKYILNISYLNQKLFNKEITLNDSVNLGILVLQKPKDNVLQTVTVTAKKKLIEQKIDRLVFNVENSIAATGGTALDALKITPRIKIKNDVISMIGKGEMLVMINDRILQLSGEDLSNYLKNISSSNIKSIEVITNPPAKYNAEGNSGIINIVTKKVKNDTWNAAIRANYRKGIRNFSDGGASFNLQKGKIQLSSDVNYYNGTEVPEFHSDIFYPNFTWKQDMVNNVYATAYNAKIGLDYKINTKLSTGFNYNFFQHHPMLKEMDKTRLFNINSNELDSSIVTQARTVAPKQTHVFNYHLIYQIDTVGRKLSLDFDLIHFQNKSDRNFSSLNIFPNGQTTSHPLTQARNFGTQNIQNYSLNLDMEHPTKWAKLNYGSRISFTETANLFHYFDIKNKQEVFNANYSNQFDYKENTQALYVSIQKNISKKWETKLGLRYENTQTKGYSVTLNQTTPNNYSKLFPTFYLSYVPNSNHSFNLNYSKRIKRPQYQFLNPFRWVDNTYSYSEGNPFLQPAFVDNIALNYSYKEHLISNLYYSYINPDFEQLTILDVATNVQQIIPKNFIIKKTIGINQTAVFNLFKFWNINTSLDIYYSSTHSKIPVTLQYLSGWNSEYNISNDFTLNAKKTLFFNLSYEYVTRGVDNLDYNSSFQQLNASFKCLLLEKKLSLSLNANDIFRTHIPTYTSFSNGVKNNWYSYDDQRYVRLSINYNFGAKFDALKRERKNKEELNRAQ